MTLHEFMIAVRSGWWIIVACLFVGIAFTTGSALLRAPTFTSSATLFIVTTDQNSAAARQLDQQFVQSRATTYAGLVTTTAVLQPTAEEIAGATVGGLRGNVSAAAPAGTSLIQISATATQSALAARTANVVAQNLAKVVNTLEGTSQATNSQVVLHEVQTATPPTNANGASPVQLVLIGAVIGIAAGIIISLVVQAAPRSVRTPHDVATVSGLGSTSIPRADSTASGVSGRREAFRFLRAKLRALAGSSGVIVVAPIDIGASARAAARILAEVLSESGARVLLIDGDPGAAGRQEEGRAVDSPNNAAGELTRLVASSPLFEGATLSTGPGGVALLQTEAVDDGAARALSEQAMRAAIESAVGEYDYVVILMASVLERADAAVAAARADAVVLTAVSRETRRRNLVLALENLQALGANPAGLLIALTDLHRSDVVPTRLQAGLPADAAVPGAVQRTPMPYQFQ